MVHRNEKKQQKKQTKMSNSGYNILELLNVLVQR